MGSGQPAKISAIPEHLYRYTGFCATEDKNLTGWANSNLQDLVSVYYQLCGGSGAPAGLGSIVGQVTVQTSAAHATDTRVADVGRAIERAGSGTGPVDGSRSAMYTVVGETAATAEMRKLHDRYEHEAGVRLASMLDQLDKTDHNSLGAAETAAQIWAEHAGNPSYAAGFLNNLKIEQVVAVTLSEEDSYPISPSAVRNAHAIVTAIADGMLSPRTMRELVISLANPPANPWADPLLQEIAKNRDVSARLIASIDPTHPDGSAQIEALLKTYADSDAENSILQILTNVIKATDSPPSSDQVTLINSLVNDLKALNYDSLSSNEEALSAFISTAVSRLVPPMKGYKRGSNDFTGWLDPCSANLQALWSLVHEIGDVYQGHADSVEFWRGLGENLGTSVIIWLFNFVPGLGVVADAVALAADTGIPQSVLDDLIPGGHPQNGAQAQYQFEQLLRKLILLCGVERLYTALVDHAGAKSIMRDHYFDKVVLDDVLAGEAYKADGWFDEHRHQLPDGSSLKQFIESLNGTFPELAPPGP